jgi:radical SAM superfamily enzyme YgiQ (UPF0313 family)
MISRHASDDPARAPARCEVGKSTLRLLLINPRNPMVNMTNRANRWNKYRVWKPLGLLVLAGVTPREWDIEVVDENVETPDYRKLPLPDLVGVTAFTSQAPRAYEIAAVWRQRGVPVVMGGIHATMRHHEAALHVDAVVTGEAETVWPRLLADLGRGALKPLYEGGLEDLRHSRPARHDLLSGEYSFGAIQTTRGCPLNCSFCSVSAFNGKTYRHRSIEDVIADLRLIREKRVLIVDDNLIGISRKHIARTKELLRALIAADLGQEWVCQATINMADDDDLLDLARRAGCIGVFIGFESPTPEGLIEVHKRFHVRRGRDFAASVRRIQRHGIAVAGSFIIGLDVDHPGIGRRIAETASAYAVDFLNVMFLTPLPGTDLWRNMEAEGRIATDRFPEDWKYFTLTLPVGRYRNLDHDQVIDEMVDCNRRFYSWRRILARVGRNLLRRQQPYLVLIGNLSYRHNIGLGQALFREFKRIRGQMPAAFPLPPVGVNGHVLPVELPDQKERLRRCAAFQKHGTTQA